MDKSENTQLEPCCICLDDIVSDAVMLMPCEHILHGKCAKAIKDQKCPLCREFYKTCTSFEVAGWDDPVPTEETTSLEDAPDSEVWIAFCEQLKAATANDDFKNGNRITIKRPDGSNVQIIVPTSWNYGRLKEFWCIQHSNELAPCQLRFIVRGCVVNDTRVVTDDMEKDVELVVCIVQRVRGS